MSNRTARSGRKKREKKKAPLAVTILFLLLSLSLCFGLYMALKRTVRVSEITFSGNKYTKSRDLADLVRVRKGDELLAVPAGDVYERLKTSPWIRDAVIRKRLLSLTKGRIEIRVQEAVPLAVLSRKGKAFLIDGDGIVLERLREGTFLFLPLIRDIDPVKERDAYREAISCIKVLHKRRVLAYNGDVVVTGKRPEEIAIQVDDISVKIGAGDLEKKLERLAFVREEIQKRNMAVASIDLRFSDRIIVKPVTPEVSPPKQETGKAETGTTETKKDTDTGKQLKRQAKKQTPPSKNIRRKELKKRQQR